MVVLKVMNHLLELGSTLLQVLLVDLKPLSDLGPRLLGQNVLELYVELLFLLDKDIFLRDLFGLGDESLLK